MATEITVVQGQATSKEGIGEGAFVEYGAQKATKARGAFRNLVDFFTVSSHPSAYADYLAIYHPKDETA
jgi:hypothetical protein